MQTPQLDSRFEFVVRASAGARQLLGGCRPRVEGAYTTARVAQQEVKRGALWVEAAAAPDSPPQP